MPGFARRVKKRYLKKSGENGRTTAKMDAANRAMCYALRNPPPGQMRAQLVDIQKVVRKTDGQRPTLKAISLAAASFMDEKAQRGRVKGDRATSKAEDQKLMKIFRRLRPPGCGVDAQTVHMHLPKTIAAKIGTRTVIRSPGSKTGMAEETCFFRILFSVAMACQWVAFVCGWHE